MKVNDLDARWAALAGLLSGYAEVVVGRAERPEPVPEAGPPVPEWARTRGWSGWLGALPEPDLALAETVGLHRALPALSHRAPPEDLRRLCTVAAAALELPPLAEAAPVARATAPGIKARKAAQVAGFAATVAPLLADRRRVVDFGSGHGHLIAHLAAAFGVAGVGLDRDPALVAEARARHTHTAADLSFVAADLLAEAGVALGHGDVVVALHACGALCDRALARAAEAGAAVCWASCCVHRREASHWHPSAPPLAGVVAPTVPREALGLGNLALGPEGVEASRSENLAARERRRAVRILLGARGVEVAPGAELSGLNRRRAHGLLAPLAAEVLARHGLPPPTAAELDHAARQAAADSAWVRRLELPRVVLGRVLEVAVNVDRARGLAALGYTVALGTLFDLRHSPRNLGGRAAPA